VELEVLLKIRKKTDRSERTLKIHFGKLPNDAALKRGLLKWGSCNVTVGRIVRGGDSGMFVILQYKT
jgi:hypothetical protein